MPWIIVHFKDASKSDVRIEDFGDIKLNLVKGQEKMKKIQREGFWSDHRTLIFPHLIDKLVYKD